MTGSASRPPGTARGIGRSLRIYYRDPERAARMDAMHARFLSAGSLAFDVGAHVGDRVASFRRLGARVVAVEPQPAAARALRLIHGRDGGVSLVAAAAGAARGRMAMRVNVANPTVSTLSDAFIRAADGAPGWAGQSWTHEVAVDVTTLDTLIADHGLPDFVKIDVEGHEHQVLAGLSRAVPALSFEFTTIQRDVAALALDRLAALGPYGFRAALGESHVFAGPDWVGAAAMRDWMMALPVEANSGDIYAALRPR